MMVQARAHHDCFLPKHPAGVHFCSGSPFFLLHPLFPEIVLRSERKHRSRSPRQGSKTAVTFHTRKHVLVPLRFAIVDASDFALRTQTQSQACSIDRDTESTDSAYSRVLVAVSVAHRDICGAWLDCADCIDIFRWAGHFCTCCNLASFQRPLCP